MTQSLLYAYIFHLARTCRWVKTLKCDMYIYTNKCTAICNEKAKQQKKSSGCRPVWLCVLSHRHKKMHPGTKRWGVCESCTEKFFRSAQRTRQYIQLPCAHTHTHSSCRITDLRCYTGPFVVHRNYFSRLLASTQKREHSL